MNGNNKRIIPLLIVVFLSVSGLGFYLWNKSNIPKNASIDEVIHQLFKLRNKAILENDVDVLEALYDKEIENGLLAYENELNKIEGFHKWSNKQWVNFKSIDSNVTIRDAQVSGEEVSLDLLVSTEYQYIYEDMPQKTNSFRIGTYHTLDIKLDDEEGWLITKEWYGDPFAKPVEFDNLNLQEIRKLIAHGETRDNSNMDERRIRAVDYADQFCGAASLPQHGFKYNPNYDNYTNKGGDCTNFASQVLYEGGDFQRSSTWNYDETGATEAWVNASAFNDYMLHNERASIIAQGSYDKVLKASYKLLPGDYIAYQEDEEIAHISIVTGSDSKGYALVNSHNSDRYRVPWDIGWNSNGISYWIIRVNY